MENSNLENNPKEVLMKVGNIEGWSFIILVFIAMPMKYMMGIEIATKIVGMIHGGLFVWFLFSLYNFHTTSLGSFKLTFVGFIASLIPFGTFFYNKKLAILN